MTAGAGQKVVVHAETASRDETAVQVSFRIYEEVSADWAGSVRLNVQNDKAKSIEP